MRLAWSKAWPIALALATTPAWAQDLNDTQRQGQHLFNQSCRVCHAKPQLNSAQYGPVLSKETLGGQEEALRAFISNGTSRMPGFKFQFETRQINAIVAYLKTLPAPAQPAPAAH